MPNSLPSNARPIVQSVERVLSSIAKARRDLDAAEARILAMNRPGFGLSGRILGQSAQDVDGDAERLDAVLNLSGQLGLTDDDVRAAFTEGVEAHKRGW